MSFEVGDKVIDPHYGEGEVIGRLMGSNNDKVYSIEVKFGGSAAVKCYTPEGYFDKEIKHQCLFHLKGYTPAFCEEPDRHQFKTGDMVLMRDGIDDFWECHVFKSYAAKKEFPYICTKNLGYRCCIPLEGNEHLCDTRDDLEYN